MFALYPEEQYASAGLRFADIAQSIEITARNLAVTHALGNDTWNAEVTIPPATHMTDQAYYWYAPSKLPMRPGPPHPEEKVDVPTAILLQKYLLSFVITGDPNALWADDKAKICWPKYSESISKSADGAGVAIVFGADGFSVGPYDLANNRSLFWNKALWY